MHAAIVHLAPILAAEKSKTPFYIAGALLVVWALAVTVGVGLRSTSFPRTLTEQRAVMAVSAVLALATVSMAVATSGGSPSKAAAAPAAPAAPQAASGSGASSLKDEANPEGQLKFTTPSLSASAGKVTIGFKNASPLEHNLTIAQGTKVLGATPTFTGATKTLTLSLKPGTYKFYCTVPGHREAGMEGTLTVS
jgi:uncharacterized cupredoxin-like copper-binding protein